MSLPALPGSPVGKFFTFTLLPSSEMISSKHMHIVHAKKDEGIGTQPKR